jgi:hypothetical protein
MMRRPFTASEGSLAHGDRDLRHRPDRTANATIIHLLVGESWAAREVTGRLEATWLPALSR